jgi:L-iditol 2-dehydrogenase
MKAAVYYGAGDIRVEDCAEPAPTPENLIVKVCCCAICGTDLKLATIGYARCHPPRIIGHEMVGEIVHAGSQVRGFDLGSRVTLATTVSCGQCAYCVLGLGNLCLNAKPISYDFDGAMAEYLAVPQQALAVGNVIRVPDSVPDEAAALSEPLSCAINAHQLAGLKAGDRVLIIGGGPLGAIHAELATAEGAAEVMVVELSEPRLALLRGLRNVLVIDGAHQDVAAVVGERTNGLGADIVIVCAPARQAMERAIQYARKGGAVSLFASLPKGASEITFDSRTIHYGELRIVGSSDSRPEHVEAVIRLMAEGKMDTRNIVTHRMNLANLHQGLDLMKNQQCLKVLVYPNGVKDET